MSIKFPGPRIPTSGLPDKEDIARLDAQRAHEALWEEAADSESERRAERAERRAATNTAVQDALKA